MHLPITSTRRGRAALTVGAALALGALACALPTGLTQAPPAGQPVPPPTAPLQPTAAPPTEAAPPGPDVAYEGVSFNYDPAIAAGVSPQTVPFEQIEANTPMGGSIPEHRRFDFTGYANADTFHEPRIVVYPVADFEAANGLAARFIGEMRTFLAERPAVDPAAFDQSIPFLPIFNAAQVIRTHVEFIDFQNGSGVRFLTEYSQAIVTINNHSLFYTFQGMTADGAYYVAAVLPVTNAILPADDFDVPGGDYDAWAANYEQYLVDTVAQLEAQPPASFTPDLALLDAMIQSLRVE